MKNNSIERLHENVKMPDHQFLVNFFNFKRDVKGAIFPMHWHEQIEMIYLTQGVMRIHCNHQSYEPRAGDLLFINGNELHAGYLIQEPLSLYCMIVDLSMLQSRFVDACEEKYIHPIYNNFIIFKNLIEQDPDIGLCFEKIAREYSEKIVGYELAIKASIIDLVVHLFRRYALQILSNREYDSRNNNMRLVNTALQHIYNHFTDHISLETLADQLGLSKYHLCHQFKKLTGKTMMDYINNYRISQSFNMLHQPELKIADIAMRVGFDDVCYFNRVFKKYTGISPTHYKKQSSELLSSPPW